ncbi:hypothetical protein [Fictibacillus phosphorivorans]|uniref:hypothetical protein n=1 Tax=Fictibacillus phosphorivorans TaxID=1221500 RepID=UPI0012E92D03|nr:hypothetical protein [Fictibacillus phosphorivorans]
MYYAKLDKNGARAAAEKHAGRAIPDFYERFQTFTSDSRLLRAIPKHKQISMAFFKE